MSLIKKLDQNLLDLAWSLWTELGVAGVRRKHKNVLILVEELILFTSVLSSIDPRLRDESIDWCSQFSRFVSISRLKSLMEDFEQSAKESFSEYAATLNKINKTNWPVFIDAHPLKIRLSQKSVLRPHASPALLNIRARAIFGSGSRADLVTFFLVHPATDFSVADTSEMGYSKRSLADVLDDLHFGKLFVRFVQGNQQRYRLNKDSPLFQMLQPIPEYHRPWRLVFKTIISLRSCIKRLDHLSDSTKAIEINNCLVSLEMDFQKLGVTPPVLCNNFSEYLESFSQWLLEWTNLLSEGK